MAETMINNPQLPPNPTKFYTHFLYKAIFVSIFLLLLPLFPSQAPDFINNKTINTTSWEFLQLVFVGIAVSYGLFSKRNDETPKEEGAFKPDNPQSYVAKLLQVSSVFDDDSDNPSPPGSNDKVQTWNSQYYRGEPIVVVAKESDDTTTVEKPLLLPVRSLKNRLSDPSTTESNPNSFNRSNSRRISRNLSRLTPEETEENIVLRSPIPWRSRSGKMEPKEDCSDTNNPIESPSFRYQYVKSSNPGLNPSPEYKTHDSSPTLRPEIHSVDDIRQRSFTNITNIKKQSSFKQTQPPPPPPPPPPPIHRPATINHTHNTIRSYPEKELRRNSRSVPEQFQNRGRARKGTEFTTRSFRTRKDSEFDEYLSHDREIERFIERKGSQSKKFMDDDEDIEYPKTEYSKTEYPKTEYSETEYSETEYTKTEEKDLNKVKEEEEGEGYVKDGEMMEGDNGPDVDKKADEFIAKFREQIRLQRIASIRKSTTQNGPR